MSPELGDAERMHEDTAVYLRMAGWLTSDRCEAWAPRIVDEEGVPAVRRCKGCDDPAVERNTEDEPVCAYHASNRRAFRDRYGT